MTALVGKISQDVIKFPEKMESQLSKETRKTTVELNYMVQHHSDTELNNFITVNNYTDRNCKIEN
jgi:cell division septal protein FtsQ